MRSVLGVIPVCICSLEVPVIFLIRLFPLDFIFFLSINEEKTAFLQKWWVSGWCSASGLTGLAFIKCVQILENRIAEKLTHYHPERSYILNAVYLIEG